MVSDKHPEELRLGRYVLRRPLGKGGNGQVFLGWQTNATKVPLVCVVKFLLSGHAISETQRVHLLEEAELVMELGNHPNIVQILDVDKYKGMPFIVMEYVNGMDLGHLLSYALRRREGLSLTSVYTVLTGVAKGLHHAHLGATSGGKSIGVVHRDIKPPNVLITRDGEVKLADFGLGRTITDGTTGDYIRGTYRYMSPEHLNRSVTPAMDIYALGVMAWELVENRRYREGCEGTQHITAIMDGDVPPMKNPRTPKELVALIHACLEPNARQRPTARQFLLSLRQCPQYLHNPEELASALSSVMGTYRASGKTGPSKAATPELAATFAALDAVLAGEQVQSGVTRRGEERPQPVPPRGLDDAQGGSRKKPLTNTVRIGPMGGGPRLSPSVAFQRPPIGHPPEHSATAVLSFGAILDRAGADGPLTETEKAPPPVTPPAESEQVEQRPIAPEASVERDSGVAVQSPGPAEPVVARSERRATEPGLESSNDPEEAAAGMVLVDDTLPGVQSRPSPAAKGSRVSPPRWFWAVATLAVSVMLFAGLGIALEVMGHGDASDSEQVAQARGPQRALSPSNPSNAAHVPKPEQTPVEASAIAMPQPVAPAAGDTVVVESQQEPTVEPEVSPKPVPTPGDGSRPASIPEPTATRPAVSAPKKPRAPAGPVSVRFALFLLDKAQVRFDGGPIALVRSSRDFEIAPGRHRIEWRPLGAEDWHDMGKVRLSGGKRVLIRLAKSGKAEIFKLDPKPGAK